jgi:hypothetical protein
VKQPRRLRISHRRTLLATLSSSSALLLAACGGYNAPPPDTTPPTAPTNLIAAASSDTQINLTWTASTDNVAVTGYKVERCQGAGCSNFAQISTTTTTTFNDTGLTPSTSYSYRVRATDYAGNLSSYSATSTASTSADTTAPTAPSNLVATTASATQINLTWTASTDDVAVIGYRVERCQGAACANFTQISTPTTTALNDIGLTASTSYSYRVRATDAAGNLSNYSGTATATTQVPPPMSVSLTPARGGLTLSQSLPFTATVQNDVSSAGVTWSTTGGGSFSTTSTTAASYVAPNAAGSVTVTATSISDPSKFASATIGVTDLAGVYTYHNDISRTGENIKEYALTASTVNHTTFGKRFSCTVDAAIYAQPLWVANLMIGGASHNVVFVATERDTLYAIDADTSPCSILWKTGAGGVNSLIPPGESSVTSGDVSCGDLQPDIGITGTPVIDLATNTMYLVTKTKTTGTSMIHQRLHALNIATGAEKFSGPILIAATVPGTGNGSTGNPGMVSFDASLDGQRSALLLENGHVVIAWASHCDFGPYLGWVMSYSANGATPLTLEAAFNTSPNGILSGVWMSGGGPAADAGGNIYFATGNGSFDANTGGTSYGDSIVKLGPPAAGAFPVLSYFAPLDQATLENNDTDLGSGGLLLLPDLPSGAHKQLLVQAGKDGRIFLADRTSLGGFNSASNNVVQQVDGQIPGGIWGSPAYWSGHVFYGPVSGNLIALSFNAGGTGLLSATSTSQSTNGYGYPGPTPSVSASGTTNGIVWTLDNTVGNQVLYGYDATDLSKELYDTTQAAGGRDTGGAAVKFSVPTVANGKVYVGSQNALTVYGLLPN